MGQKLDRIEKQFVLNSVIEQKIKLKIHGNKKEIEGKLIDYTNDEITINLINSFEFSSGDELRIFFFFNKSHTFNSLVKEIRKESIIIENPEGIYKSLERKHERIKAPENANVFFLFKGTNIALEFPKTIHYSRDKHENKSDFEKRNIKDLIQDFRAQMKNKVSSNEIIILRNRLVDTFEEKFLCETTKSLWIPSTLEDIPKTDPFPDNRIITKKDFIEYEKNMGTPESFIKSHIENILFEKTKTNIYSELYTPILYMQYFVGYIHLINNMDNQVRINRELFETSYAFSKILCHTMELNGYFDSKNNEDRKYKPTIINISASGILFSLPTNTLSSQIHLHTDINLNLIIKKRKLEIFSRVIRKFTTKNQLFLGLQYLEISPEDYRYLFETIYGKALDDNSDNYWEGGSEPPPLQLD